MGFLPERLTAGDERLAAQCMAVRGRSTVGGPVRGKRARRGPAAVQRPRRARRVANQRPAVGTDSSTTTAREARKNTRGQTTDDAGSSPTLASDPKKPNAVRASATQPPTSSMTRVRPVSAHTEPQIMTMVHARARTATTMSTPPTAPESELRPGMSVELETPLAIAPTKNRPVVISTPTAPSRNPRTAAVITPPGRPASATWSYCCPYGCCPYCCGDAYCGSAY